MDESTICGSNKDVSPDIRENNKLQLSELSCSIPVTDDANTCVKEHAHGKCGNTQNVKKKLCQMTVYHLVFFVEICSNKEYLCVTTFFYCITHTFVIYGFDIIMLHVFRVMIHYSIS